MLVSIVEDDIAVSDSLAALLGCHQHRTEIFGSAEDFLQSPSLSSFECVIADIRLPGISGLELLRKVRQQEIRTPFIIVSGHGEAPSALAEDQLGPLKYLEKPCQPEQLLAAVAGLP